MLGRTPCALAVTSPHRRPSPVEWRVSPDSEVCCPATHRPASHLHALTVLPSRLRSLWFWIHHACALPTCEVHRVVRHDARDLSFDCTNAQCISTQGGARLLLQRLCTEVKTEKPPPTTWFCSECVAAFCRTMTRIRSCQMHDRQRDSYFSARDACFLYCHVFLFVIRDHGTCKLGQTLAPRTRRVCCRSWRSTGSRPRGEGPPSGRPSAVSRARVRPCSRRTRAQLQHWRRWKRWLAGEGASRCV